MVALNSNCSEIGGCGRTSPQGRWLAEDLAANPSFCTLAYWHHPRFSSSENHGSSTATRDLWAILYEHAAEVVLQGHDHNYERFGPQDADGNANPLGVRSFVVGTGGRSHYGFDTPEANSEVRNDDTYGVLELTLRPASYDWRFVPVEGQTFTDSGTATCVGRRAASAPSSRPCSRSCLQHGVVGSKSSAVRLPLAALFALGAFASNAALAADPVVLAAGDIANCESEGDEQTADLLAANTGTILLLGDIAYPDGSDDDFEECFDPSWGAHKARIRPSPGNHEYHTDGAEGYFDYFGAAAGDPDEGWYSFDLGEWHIVSLNSNCDEIGGCGASSAQGQWLAADLAANPSTCTLAYWHHPRFSSSTKHGSDDEYEDLWEILDEADADLVLVGHDHGYERFAPQDKDGNASANGIREFVVGTGGAERYDQGSAEPNSEMRDDGSWGVLKLTLRAAGYDWQFLPVPATTSTTAAARAASASSGRRRARARARKAATSTATAYAATRTTASPTRTPTRPMSTATASATPATPARAAASTRWSARRTTTPRRAGSPAR